METPQKTRKAAHVAIVGRPNVGKSTLLNRVIGSKLSIVTPKAQTTRDRVLGILTEERGQIVFVDTPGIHNAKPGGINEYMVRQAEEALEGVDAVWYLIDPLSGFKYEGLVMDRIKRANAPVFVLFNKFDLKTASPLFKEQIAAALPGAKMLEISARLGTNVEELLELTWAVAPAGEFSYPDEEQLSDRPMRFFAAEKIREQLLRQLGEELPYCCAIEIEKFEEDTKPVRIEAIIHVERDSQKGMVIGAKGAKIKAIGTEARGTLEKLIGGPVFLGLRVNVLKDWSRDEVTLKRLGYEIGRRK